MKKPDNNSQKFADWIVPLGEEGKEKRKEGEPRFWVESVEKEVTAEEPTCQLGTGKLQCKEADNGFLM